MKWYCMECGYECEVQSLDGARLESVCCEGEVSDDLQDFDPDIDSFSTYANHNGEFADND